MLRPIVNASRYPVVAAVPDTVFPMTAPGLHEVLVGGSPALPKWPASTSSGDLQNRLVGVALAIAAPTCFLSTAKSDKGKAEK